MLYGWHWSHNFHLNPRGRILVAWKPNVFGILILDTSDQYIHWKVTIQSNMKHFFITFVYGENHEANRKPLWDALAHIASSMDEPWCVLGDFNSVFYTGDRMGGNQVQDFKIHPFAEYVATWSLLK